MSELLFDTGLDERAFGKSNFSTLLNERGFIASANSAISPNMTFSFREWKFDGVKTVDRALDDSARSANGTIHSAHHEHAHNASSEHAHVCFYGAFSGAKTILDMLDELHAAHDDVTRIDRAAHDERNAATTALHNGAHAVPVRDGIPRTDVAANVPARTRDTIATAQCAAPQHVHSNDALFTATCAVFAACCALDQAVRENIPLAQIGAGGIFVHFETDSASAAFDGSAVTELNSSNAACGSTTHADLSVSTEKITLLFLPAKLFDAASACKGASAYAAAQGAWCSKLLTDEQEQLLFTQSAIVYCALTHHAPFTAIDETERHADERDKQFLRLEHVVNGINDEVARAVDSALELPHSISSSNTVQPVQLFQTAFPLEKLHAELGIGNRSIVAVSRPNALSENEFKKNVAAYYAAKTRIVKRSRAIRRNAALITGIVIACAVAVLFAITSHTDNGRKPTARGLTSSHVVELFYQAMHTQDVELVRAMSSGKAARRYTNMVSSVYVVNKARSAYEPSNSIVTPEVWLLLQSGKTATDKRTVYGITSFMLDGNVSLLRGKAPTRNMKMQPIVVERGVQLADGATAVHTAEYYTVYTTGEKDDFFVTRNSDTVTLTYKNKQWRVTDISAHDSDIHVDSDAFKAAVIEAFAFANGDAVHATNLLREQFSWLPYAAVVAVAQDLPAPF
ncbi:MAG: hypothetical protein J6I73_08200 [Treponema sp.]|nr:hypothetical protein [Treponema sp.]